MSEYVKYVAQTIKSQPVAAKPAVYAAPLNEDCSQCGGSCNKA